MTGLSRPLPRERGREMTPPILPQLFNSYVEIHTAQLGILLGLFFGILHRKYPRAAYGLLFCGVAFAFGNGTPIGYSAIDRKPWYFLTALYASTVVNLLATTYGPVLVDRNRPEGDAPRPDSPEEFVISEETPSSD